MSIKTAITSRIVTSLLSESRQARRRARTEAQRQRRDERHRIDFFHQVDDPYSHLLVQALETVVERYDVEVCLWLVPPPDDWAAPLRPQLNAYSLADARRLARRAGLSFGARALPEREAVRSAQRALAAVMEREPEGGRASSKQLLERAAEIGEALWSGRACETAAGTGNGLDASVERLLARGRARRDEEGHYLGATCLYGGEWTWGIDRLFYLEERLAALGARRPDAPARPVFEPPSILEDPPERAALTNQTLPDLHFFLSFRSPYTYIVSERVQQLATAYGVGLQLRFVLPMVMRGLPVNRTKGFYILRDAAREARRLDVPFGRIADPVGRPTERGYSLLPWAIDEGRGIEYCRSFLTRVWSEGVDAGSRPGMRQIVEAAGLPWNPAREVLESGGTADHGWRKEAAANRSELASYGLWGVPSFRVGDLAVWGQDRLWVLEDEYKRILNN